MFRWIALAILLATLSISTFYRRRARREGGTIPRRSEGKWFMAARLAVGLPLWLSILAYVVNPRWMQWAAFPSPEWLRWIGAGLGVMAVPAALWVFQSIGQNVSETVLTKNQHELVTHGPYRWVRHPLYAVGSGLIMAIGLLAANWFIVAFALLALVLIRTVVIPREETVLLATFGDRYREYMGQTGGMVPRPFGRSRSARSHPSP